jgi:hypothetical protein
MGIPVIAVATQVEQLLVKVDRVRYQRPRSYKLFIDGHIPEVCSVQVALGARGVETVHHGRLQGVMLVGACQRVGVYRTTGDHDGQQIERQERASCSMSTCQIVRIDHVDDDHNFGFFVRHDKTFRREDKSKQWNFSTDTDILIYTITLPNIQ